MREVIERDWARERREDLLAVEITALGGRRPDGIWSRPDITIVEVRTFARTHGVGVVAAADPQDYDTWEELKEARRVQPTRKSSTALSPPSSANAPAA